MVYPFNISTFLLQDDYKHSVTLRNLAFKDYLLKKYSALKKKGFWTWIRVLNRLEKNMDTNS